MVSIANTGNPRPGDAGRLGLSLLRMILFWTTNYKRGAGLLLPVVAMVGIRTAEMLDNPQGVGKAAVPVEISQVVSLVHSSSAMYLQWIRGPPVQPSTHSV